MVRYFFCDCLRDYFKLSSSQPYFFKERSFVLRDNLRPEIFIVKSCARVFPCYEKFIRNLTTEANSTVAKQLIDNVVV